MAMNFKKWFNKQPLKNHIQQVAQILSRVLSPVPLTENRSRIKAHSVTEKYWLEPSPVHSWLKQHGIEISPGQLPRYAEGGVGRVYFVNDDHVVKFSANKVEANVASMSASNKQLPTPIIDVLPLGGGLYAILQHLSLIHI